MKYFPLACFIVVGTMLSIIDVRQHRLPNKIVSIFSALLVAFLILFSPVSELKSSLQIGIGFLVIFGALVLVSRGALGMGDAKYAFACGLVVGVYQPELWLGALWLMFSLAAIVSLIGMGLKIFSRQSRIAFGPYMTLATTLIALNSLRLG